MDGRAFPSEYGMYRSDLRNRNEESESRSPRSCGGPRSLLGHDALHVLHHSTEGPIFGLEMAEELARHGYRISAGTLYPLLHGLEKKGYLRSTTERHGKSFRKIYRPRRSVARRSRQRSPRFGSCLENSSRESDTWHRT